MNYSVSYTNENEAYMQYDNYNSIIASVYGKGTHLVTDC
jgi:hypothetical protein